MKTISRDHNFEDRLDLVWKGTKYYYLFHEKNKYPVRVRRTPELHAAFAAQDWDAFVKAEAKALRGEARA